MDYDDKGKGTDYEEKGKTPLETDPFHDAVPLQPKGDKSAEPSFLGEKSSEFKEDVKERPFSDQSTAAAWPSGVPPGYLTRPHTMEVVHDKNYINLVDPKTRNTRKRRFGRHCARYWICYLLCQIVFFAIFLPILFLVIFPQVAQAIVNKQALEIHKALLLNPTPDSQHLSLFSSITVPAPFVVNLDALNMSLYLKDVHPNKPYVYIELPKNSLRHPNATIQVTNQLVHIADQAQFLEFLNETVWAEEFTLSAKGETTGHFGKLKAPIKLNKNVKLKGLNKLEGLTVMGSALTTPDAEGYNFKATLMIPNYSAVTFDLGNVTFNLKIQDPPYPDIALGLGIIHNLTLAPGNNTVPFLGHLDFRTLLTQLQRILRAEAQSLQEGVLTLWINGNSTIYHGQHIPYYETILQGLVLPTTIPIQQLLVGTLGGTLNNSAGTLQNIVQALNLTALAPPNEVSRAMEIVQARMDENLRVR